MFSTWFLLFSWNLWTFHKSAPKPHPHVYALIPLQNPDLYLFHSFILFFFSSPLHPYIFLSSRPLKITHTQMSWKLIKGDMIILLIIKEEVILYIVHNVVFVWLVLLTWFVFCVRVFWFFFNTLFCFDLVDITSFFLF